MSESVPPISLKERLGLNRFDSIFAGSFGQRWSTAVESGCRNLTQHGKWNDWLRAVESIETRAQAWELDRDAPFADATPSEACLSMLRDLGPWKKGPFQLGTIQLDAEWRSDLKWRRLLDHLGSLENDTILDVGTGNGYFLLRALGSGARQVLGLEPCVQYVSQYLAISKIFPDQAMGMLSVPAEEFPIGCCAFDTVLSMGVLYHRRAPLDHIAQLVSFARPGGRIVIETMVVDGPEGHSLIPQGRYANMKNVWCIPSVATLRSWLLQSSVENIKISACHATGEDEQRSTEWSGPVSLKDGLDPNDRGRTVEGHPAPVRIIISGTTPDWGPPHV